MERSYLVSCEHASNAVPDDVDLGVDAIVLASHVGWDPGAAPVAIALADALGTTAMLGNFTRLVADLNRPPNSDVVVPEIAFGVEVPGNRANERAALIAARLAAYHTPYWMRARAGVETALSSGSCLHVSVHSFDPNFTDDPRTRDFDIGLLYDPAFANETALAARLEQALCANGFTVRHNEPYAGTGEGLVTALRHEYPAPDYTSLELELNQTRLAHPEQAEPKLIESLRAALAA
jgi:predicted N-formylglutamate amidohydrolase